METIATWNRRFGLWHYTISHSTLLLRSINIGSSPQRIDVAFVGVSRLSICETYETLAIHQADDSEKGVRLAAYGFKSSEVLYLLNDGLDYIVALKCAWHEDDGDQHSPSRFGPLRGTS
jgi:hypothetical protein